MAAHCPSGVPMSLECAGGADGFNQNIVFMVVLLTRNHRLNTGALNYDNSGFVPFRSKGCCSCACWLTEKALPYYYIKWKRSLIYLIN